MGNVYRLGLLVVVFGGFFASNSTGIYRTVGISALFVGFLIGLFGLLQTALATSE